MIGKDNCVMVYLNPPISVCKQRDPSGLYAAAEGTESADIPGVSFPYDVPENPHLVLDTSSVSVEECIDKVYALIKAKGIV